MKNPIFTLTTLAFLGLSTTYAQVKVGDNPTSINSSAAFEVESTSKGILPPRMSNTERDAINSPAEGLIIYNSTESELEMFNGTSWVSIISGLITSGACIGEPATISFQGLKYCPVESSGKCWLDRNLGASRVATSSTDAQSYGDLYQWGRAADGHEKRNSPLHDGTTVRPNTITETGVWDGKFITIPSSTNRDDWVTTQTNNAWNTGTASAPMKTATDPCPAGYRLPTEAEWLAERSSWGSSNYNAAGAYASPLKLPMAGERSNSGSLLTVGTYGNYWSSSVSGSSSRYLLFYSSMANMNTFRRARGHSVRCIKD